MTIKLKLDINNWRKYTDNLISPPCPSAQEKKPICPNIELNAEEKLSTPFYLTFKHLHLEHQKYFRIVTFTRG